MTTSIPQRGTQRPKEIVCRGCGTPYLGHHLSKQCDDCLTVECATPGCSNKFCRRGKQGGTRYCSPECKG